MEQIDMNLFMQEVHQNAVAHGWWDEEKSSGTMRSLLHCELSEAMEEYRKGNPLVWRQCNLEKIETPCAKEDCIKYCNGICELRKIDKKPEGAAVELMDFVIRILDWIAREKENMTEIEKARVELDLMATERSWLTGTATKKQLPDLIDVLHYQVVCSRVEPHFTACLIDAVQMAMKWVEAQGIDPVRILKEKHEYNKTRAYKHGGKVC